LKTVCKPYSWWVAKIKSQEPFTFVRFGDGELNGMFWVGRGKGGGRTKNGDGHTLRNKDLRYLLRQSAKQPPNSSNYYRSLWMDGNCQPMEILAREHLPGLVPNVTWYNALAIHFANVEGRNYPYFQAMRQQKRPVVVIGPRHLRAIDKAGCFNYTGFVEVPYRRAFFQRERIVEEALQYPADSLYSIHAGPPSPVFAWQLWKERGGSATILDLGSILDGYVAARFGGTVEGGAPITRKFWKKYASRDILRRNLTGK